MKKLVLLAVLCSVTIMSYSQDVISLTTKYVYDYYDRHTYTHRVSFVITSETLKITEEETKLNISGTYYVVSSSEIYDNELGQMFQFIVEKRPQYTNPPYKKYVLSVTKGIITFNPYGKETVDYLFLFNN